MESRSVASEAGPASSESTNSPSSVMPHSSSESTIESERASSSSDSDLPLDIANDKSEAPVQPKVCSLVGYLVPVEVGHSKHIGTKNFAG